MVRAGAWQPPLTRVQLMGQVTVEHLKPRVRAVAVVLVQPEGHLAVPAGGWQPPVTRTQLKGQKDLREARVVGLDVAEGRRVVGLDVAEGRRVGRDVGLLVARPQMTPLVVVAGRFRTQVRGHVVILIDGAWQRLPDKRDQKRGQNERTQVTPAVALAATTLTQRDGHTVIETEVARQRVVETAVKLAGHVFTGGRVGVVPRVSCKRRLEDVGSGVGTS